MSHHYLLDADRFRRLDRESPRLWREFGTLKAEQLRLHQIQQIKNQLAGDPRRLWESFFSEELLLMVSTGKVVPVDVLAFFNEVCPFKNGVRLRDLLEKPCALAVFPLVEGNSSPGWGHVWVVDGLKERDSAIGGELIPSRLGLLFSTSHEKWTGASWQLAGSLAMKALQSKDMALRAALAQDWIITGAVKQAAASQNRLIDPVQLGNKLEIDVGKRAWLLPRANVKNVSPDQQSTLIIRSATDVDAAWDLVAGQGTKQGQNKSWPADIDELHMLIGENIKAQVASVLLTPTCRKIVLWTSENREFSIKPAGQIREVLAKISGVAVPEIRQLKSGDIAENERELRKYFEATSDRCKVLFNITSGNRLMSYAVQTIARLYPFVELIYREQGEREYHKFTHLLYTEFPPYSGCMTGVSSDVQINWNFIYGPQKYEDASDFKRKMYLPQINQVN